MLAVIVVIFATTVLTNSEYIADCPAASRWNFQFVKWIIVCVMVSRYREHADVCDWKNRSTFDSVVLWQPAVNCDRPWTRLLVYRWTRPWILDWRTDGHR